MSNLMELDQQYLEALNSYREAVTIGDISAIDFYSREIDRLDNEIVKAGAEIDYYSDDWD